MIGSWPWHSGRRESGGGRRKMRVDTMLACHARARFARCFPCSRGRSLLTGGPPQDGVFYEVAGAGIVHFENVSQSMY
jgi:hypothetical protein